MTYSVIDDGWVKVLFKKPLELNINITIHHVVVVVWLLPGLSKGAGQLQHDS